MPTELHYILTVAGPYGEPEPFNLPASLEAASEDIEDLLPVGWSVSIKPCEDSDSPQRGE